MFLILPKYSSKNQYKRISRDQINTMNFIKMDIHNISYSIYLNINKSMYQIILHMNSNYRE